LPAREPVTVGRGDGVAPKKPMPLLSSLSLSVSTPDRTAKDSDDFRAWSAVLW
jgi:hypothetical protein